MIGYQILNKIKEKEKYTASCIIISGEIEDSQIIKLRKSELVYSIILKSTPISQMVKKIIELSEIKDSIEYAKKINKKIINELLYLGYDISHKESKYLIKTIQYIVENSCKYDNLEKDIYPKIALMYNETSHNIKVNINRATNSMYYNCEVKRLKEYFSLSYDFKPKTKVIINMVINKIN